MNHWTAQPNPTVEDELLKLRLRESVLSKEIEQEANRIKRDPADFDSKRRWADLCVLRGDCLKMIGRLAFANGEKQKGI